MSYSVSVTFVLSSFLYHMQSFHAVQIKLYLSLSWGHASIAMPEAVKAVLTGAFCNRNNDAVETFLLCTKHCKCLVMDPLWQIFRPQCLFPFWDEKESLIHFIVGSGRWAQQPLKKCFDFSVAVSFDIWSCLKSTHLVVFFRNCWVSCSYSGKRSPDGFVIRYWRDSSVYSSLTLTCILHRKIASPLYLLFR